MRKLLVATLVSLVCVAPALAKKAPAAKPVPRDLAPFSADPNKDQSVEDVLRTQLAKAGFTDIQMVPTSFLIQAKDADGNPVTLVFSPDGLLEAKPAPQDSQNDAAGKVKGEQDF